MNTITLATTSNIVGENFLAFETLELKACCNKSAVTELDGLICALSADQLIESQTSLCLSGMDY
jgi:hypothetical protein